MSPHHRWQRKKDVRSREILKAALKIFVEKGFRAAKVEDIAHAAGVTKGTPYLYYQNKEALFKAVVQNQLVASLERMIELTRLHAGSNVKLLYKLTDAWWNEVGATETSGIFKLLIAEAAHFPELATCFNEMIIKPTHDMTASILQKGIDSGEFRPVTIAVAADVLVGTVLMAMLWQPSFFCISGIGRSMNDPQHHLRDNLDIIINGLSTINH